MKNEKKKKIVEKRTHLYSVIITTRCLKCHAEQKHTNMLSRTLLLLECSKTPNGLRQHSQKAACWLAQRENLKCTGYGSIPTKSSIVLQQIQICTWFYSSGGWITPFSVSLATLIVSLIVQFINIALSNSKLLQKTIFISQSNQSSSIFDLKLSVWWI